MKSKKTELFTGGMIGNGIIGDPPSDTRSSSQTKSFGYQVLGFGAGGGGFAEYTLSMLVVGGAGGGGGGSHLLLRRRRRRI